MDVEPPLRTPRRSDAQRNRARILDAARLVFTSPADDAATTPERSMAEIARRAGVGRGTLYRNFPTRRDLLEALFVNDVEALIAAATPSADDPGGALLKWLHRFAAFEDSKHAIAAELLEEDDGSSRPMFSSSRQRVIAAGEPLLAAAQRAGDIRRDVTLVQALDLVLAIARLDREPDQIAMILQVALDGLRARRSQ
jgi:AcrR family transcriptional regulator